MFSAEDPSVPPSASSRILEHPYPPRDQRDVPCCVSIALCAAMEILDASVPPTTQLSPLFHYYVTRPDPYNLGLLDIRAAFSTAASLGVCAQTLHAPAMTARGARMAPTPEAFADAEQRKLVGYDPARRRIQYELLEDVRAWRTALFAGFPIIAGFWVTSAYDALSKKNPVHGSPPAEPSRARHCVLILGFDDLVAEGAFLAKDSGGPGFASGGSWWLPYQTADSSLVIEAWAIRRITY
ncbi:hypothetical protein STIAU_3454 [Stigmatella aurantiaca DW4/3-1]|uniref:Peptidase C1A papain C-terminal domain-containing protein n=1 Tax=Stigmatella aurantiaca (strain DW4/3-1) TaxID=378806 RepID=Q091Z6_STIAD|nr:hypothetical protein STIAU_3454 [Stigmatella aurantiaca DW4/3-1]